MRPETCHLEVGADPVSPGDEEIVRRAHKWEQDTGGLPWVSRDVGAAPSQMMRLVVDGWAVPVGKRRPINYRLTERGRQAGKASRR